MQKELISKNQSGYKLGDLFINQPLSISHKVLTPFDNVLEVRSILLDKSKAFNRIWHKEVNFKLKQSSISSELLHILSDFWSDRKRKALLNGRSLS